MNKKVLVALSGGVDSSVCVKLLRDKGYDVSAVVMKMTPLHEKTVQAADETAKALNVPLTVLDMQEEFKKQVISFFTKSYINGKTPNPCVVCNPLVKFKALTDLAEKQGADYTATGHYARLEKDENGLVHLYRGQSAARDQSYMLYRLTQRELSRLILPLTELEKTEVRSIAAESELVCANAPDSQENCFIEDNDYAKYIRQEVGDLPSGEIIAPDGSVCATHNGIIDFTVGQRKGLGVALGRPVFVSRISAAENRVYLSDAEGLFCNEAIVSDISVISGERLCRPFEADVKIRSMAAAVAAEIIPQGEKLRVVFKSPQRAVAPGQSLVIYIGDEVIGGGFIEGND